MTSQPLQPTPTSAVPSPPAFTARCPEDILAVVPVVLGFEPEESVVMLTFGGDDTFHARLDLPRPGRAASAVADLLAPALRHCVRSVIVVVYCADGPPFRVVDRAIRRAFPGAGIEVIGVLRAHGGRWYSQGRWPSGAAGVPYDVGAHRFRARAVVEGRVVHQTREALAASLHPRLAAVTETVRALRRAVPSSAEEVADLVEHRLAQGAFTGAELCRLLLGLQDVAGRDAAWASMTRATASDHVLLWTDAVQRAPEELVGAPAAVLAVAAWLAGQGALAWCAVERCRAVEPANTLALLVADLLSHAVAPSAWERAAG